jgi:lariat debranching enzyme
LEVIDVESPGETQAPKLTFDPEWMAITRAFQPWLSRTRVQRAFPEEREARRMVSEELEWVMKKVGDGYEIGKCQVFSPGTEEIGGETEPLAYVNGQTVALCGLVEMSNRIA